VQYCHQTGITRNIFFLLKMKTPRFVNIIIYLWVRVSKFSSAAVSPRQVALKMRRNRRKTSHVLMRPVKALATTTSPPRRCWLFHACISLLLCSLGHAIFFSLSLARAVSVGRRSSNAKWLSVTQRSRIPATEFLYTTNGIEWMYARILLHIHECAVTAAMWQCGCPGRRRSSG